MTCKRCERPVAGPDTNYCAEHMPQVRLLRLGNGGIWEMLCRWFEWGKSGGES